MRSAAAKSDETVVREHLRQLAREVVSELSEFDDSLNKEMLGIFVSELFSSVAEHERRAFCRQRQAEGIETAKARGVRIGRPAAPLPENFYQVVEDWYSKKLTLNQAATACAMPESTFYYKAVQLKDTAKR